MTKKVLIVEDNNGFSRVLRDEIQYSGWDAVNVDNGVDALVRYLDGDVDIVLMDVVMPKLSGIDALRIMKKIDPNAKVIVFSGNPSDEMRQEALDLGAMEFLTKPFALKGLMKIIETA